MLSHTSVNQLDEVLATECDTFEEAHQHPHVRQHGRGQHTRLIQNDACGVQFHRDRRFWRLHGQAVMGRAGRTGWRERLPRPRFVLLRLGAPRD